MQHTFLHVVEFHLATLQKNASVISFRCPEKSLRGDHFVVRIEMDSSRVKEMNLYISSIIKYYWLLGPAFPFGPISHGNEIWGRTSCSLPLHIQTGTHASNLIPDENLWFITSASPSDLYNILQKVERNGRYVLNLLDILYWIVRWRTDDGFLTNLVKEKQTNEKYRIVPVHFVSFKYENSSQQ